MGTKPHKKGRGEPQTVSAMGQARKAGSAEATAELLRQMREAHAAAGWGKVINLWQQLAKPKGTLSPADSQAVLLAADAYCQHGVSLSGKGNLGAALTQFESAAALDPGQSRYQYRLARVRQRRGEWQQAIAAYQTVLRLNPADQRAAYHLCLTCLQSGVQCQPGGVLDQALAQLQDAMGDPSAWQVRRLQAWRAYVRSGSTAELTALYGAERPTAPVLDLEAALLALVGGKTEAARRLLPDSAAGSLHDCLAAVRTSLSARAGHHRQAVSLAEQLRRTRPAPDGSHRNLLDSLRVRALWEAGLAAWGSGERAQAAPLWEAALALRAQSFALRLNVALALDAADSRRAGQHWLELARAWERDAGKRGAADAASLRLSAAAAFERAGAMEIRNGNWREARRLLERALVLSPANADILYDLAHLAVSTGDAGWLRSRVKQLQELMWDDADRLSALGHLCEGVAIVAETEPIWRRLLELEPDHGCAGEHLCYILEERGSAAWSEGKTGEALVCFEQALAVMPSAGRIHAWLGGIYLQQKDRKRAQAAFDRAQTGDSDAEALSYAFVSVGRHLLKDGLRRDAESAFQRGLEADSSANPQLGVGLAYAAIGDTRSAATYFREAARRSQYDAATVLQAVDELNDQHAYDAALKLVTEALDRHPDDHNLWTARAFTDFSLKGPSADKAIARKARLLALQAGDQDAVRALDQMLSVM